MVRAGTPNVVPGSEAGFDFQWSPAELHTAMVDHFDLLTNDPQWRLWVFATTRSIPFRPGSVTLGIMFDITTPQRQGCAIFHEGLASVRSGAALDRYTFHTYIHEIGHCFNLLHSFDKGRASSLSYMNYPQEYRPLSGVPRFSSRSREYWRRFAFEFDRLELEHLRHGALPNIIPGDRNFGSGAASEVDLSNFQPPLLNNAGFRLKIESKPRYALGEPVVVETKLERAGADCQVNPVTHVNAEFVRFAIQKPSGDTIIYEPLSHHCVLPEPVTLSPDRPAVYDSSYLGFGKSGFVFDQIGRYRLRAVYVADDGSHIVSNDMWLRVTAPKTEADEAIADLYMGTDQGQLFYFLGSDHESFANAHHAFEQVIEDYGNHPLAVYARLVTGLNDARAFKRLYRDGRRAFQTRAPRLENSIEHLSNVVNACHQNAGVDNITANMVMRTLAQVQKDNGDEKKAAQTLEDMSDYFEVQGLNEPVIEAIDEEITSTYEALKLDREPEKAKAKAKRKSSRKKA